MAHVVLQTEHTHTYTHTHTHTHMHAHTHTHTHTLTQPYLIHANALDRRASSRRVLCLSSADRNAATCKTCVHTQPILRHRPRDSAACWSPFSPCHTELPHEAACHLRGRSFRACVCVCVCVRACAHVLWRMPTCSVVRGRYHSPFSSAAAAKMSCKVGQHNKQALCCLAHSMRSVCVCARVCMCANAAGKRVGGFKH